MFGVPAHRVFILSLFALSACSGNFSCTACDLAPIPGGFDESILIRRSAQVRIAGPGLDFIEQDFAGLISAYSPAECGGPQDVPCPPRFDGDITCHPTLDVCVDVQTQAPVPVLGFEIERSTSSGATVCRDDDDDPNKRTCYMWLQLENLDLDPEAPNKILATVGAQLLSNVIPIRYDALGADCIIEINSRTGSGALPEFLLTIEGRPWTSPTGTGGRQLELFVSDVALAVDDEDVTISRDPNSRYSNALDAVTCGLGNLSAIKNALIPAFASSFTGTIDKQVRGMLAARCGFGLPACPGGTSCNVDGKCQDATGTFVPMRAAIQGRLSLDELVGDLALAPVQPSDLGFLLGGDADADPTGYQVGMMAGFEAVSRSVECALDRPNPRTAPSFQSPPPLPSSDLVDLDFDGTPETPYMVAIGLSRVFIDQALWSAYTTGAICLGVSTYNTDQLTTGTLSLLVPSLSLLTHSDRDPSSVWPVQILLRAAELPSATLGSGQTTSTGRVVDPLLTVNMPEVALDFMAIVEERWVHIMTVTGDLALPFGAAVNANNEVELLTGDLTNAFSNVRVSNNRLLGESAEQIETSLPGLLSVFLPQISGSFLDPIALPDASSLGGFGLDIMAVQGAAGPSGGYAHAAVYANLDFDPGLALSVRAKTEVELLHVRGPRSLEHAEVHLRLPASSADGRLLEHQIRIGNGLWQPFFQGAEKIVADPVLSVQGHHRLSVRSRFVGNYRSLDPEPVEFDLIMDGEPPRLETRLDARAGGVYLSAWDVVSGTHLRFELGVDGDFREVRPDARGFVVIPELEEASAELRIAAIDEQGLRNEVTLRRGYALASDAPGAPRAESGGCSSVPADSGAAWLAVFALGLLLVRRRRA